jgi:HK97 family phage major capsid protein
MTMGTLLHLSDLRESGQYVFPGLQNLERPVINGFPVLASEAYQGKKHVGFGLAAQLYFGDAVSMEMTVGEATGDFETDMQTVRAVLACDWALRHTQAFAFLTGVSYGT